MLVHKMSYLINFENFHFFFDFQQKLSISEKITKNQNFQNWPNMIFYGQIWIELAKFTQ